MRNELLHPAMEEFAMKNLPYESRHKPFSRAEEKALKRKRQESLRATRAAKEALVFDDAPIKGVHGRSAVKAFLSDLVKTQPHHSQGRYSERRA
jgi:hypothetical protein